MSEQTPTTETTPTIEADVTIVGAPPVAPVPAEQPAPAPEPAKPNDKTGALAEEPTAEQKAAADKATADAEAAKDPEVPADKPFDLKAPEGFEGLDQTALDKAQPILRELGIKTNGQAQKAIDAFSKEVLPGMVERGIAAHQAKFEEMVATTRKEWADAAAQDPETGGNKEKLDATVAHAVKFRDRFGTPALTEILNSTGLGNNVEVIRLFARAGKAISEGAFHLGDTGATTRKTDEEVFYGNTYKQKN